MCTFFFIFQIYFVLSFDTPNYMGKLCENQALKIDATIVTILNTLSLSLAPKYSF